MRRRSRASKKPDPYGASYVTYPYPGGGTTITKLFRRRGGAAAILLGMTASVAAGASAFAQASAQVDALASFVGPIAVTGVNALDFGTAITPSAPATVTISPLGARSTNGAGGLTLVSSAGNTGQAASYSILSDGGLQFSMAFTQLAAPSGYSLGDYRVAGCSVAADTATTTIQPGVGFQNCVLSVGATLSVPAGATGAVDLGQLELLVSYF